MGDSGEDLGSGTHGNSTSSRKWIWAMLIIPTLISTHNNRVTQCTTQGENIATSTTSEKENDGIDVAIGVNYAWCRFIFKLVQIYMQS